MKHLIWRLRLALFPLPPHHYGDPNFLFSLPPFVHPGRVPTVVIEPSGGDDSPNMQRALNRLAAIGGGTLHFTEGDYVAGQTVYLP